MRNASRRSKRGIAHLFAPPNRRLAAAPFTPAQVAGLALWLKADALALADGAPVAAWPDASAHNNNAVATGAAQPTFKTNILNGNPVVRFNGAGQLLTIADAPSLHLGALTAFAVFQQSGSTGVIGPVFTKNATAAGAPPVYEFSIFNGGNAVGAFTCTVAGALQNFLGGAAYANNTLYISEVVEGGGAWKQCRNGIYDGSGATPGGAGFDSSTGSLQIGGENGSYGGSYYFQGDLAELLLYNAVLNPTDAQNVFDYLNNKWNAQAATAPKSPQLVCHGDSLTYGYQLADPVHQSYPAQLGAALGASWSVIGHGTPGYTLTQLGSEAPTVVDSLYAPTRAENVVALWGGVNDLVQGATVAATLANIQTYCNARRLVGERVIVLTLPPSQFAGTPASYEANRLAVNAALRSTYSTFADALADVGGDPNIGNVANTAANTIDGLHLQAAGYAVVASYVSSALDQL